MVAETTTTDYQQGYNDATTAIRLILATTLRLHSINFGLGEEAMPDGMVRVIFGEVFGVQAANDEFGSSATA